MHSFRLQTRSGETHEIVGRDGLSVMDAIRRAGVYELEATCGGACSCATCHVYIQAPDGRALPPMGEMENDLLETSDHRRSSSRLSCQIRLAAALDGMTVEIAPED